MAETQRADQQAGHDLVADAQQQRAFEHPVAEADGRAHRDHIAAEQRQLHRILPLRHPVAHGGHPARDLRGRAALARENLDLLGIAAVGLMRAEHVVIRADDADIHRLPTLDRRLVLPTGGKAVGEVAAGERGPVHAFVTRALDQVEIAGPPVARTLHDPVGDAGDGVVQGHCALQ